jgi:DNA adenine methylase
VPFGRYDNPTICDPENLRLVSLALAQVDLRCESAFDIGKRAERGDLVYLDPPYDPVSPTASFTSYARFVFGKDEQAQLADVFRSLAHRGVSVVLSNSDTPFIRELYKDFRIETVYARRAINSRADRRGHVAEVIVTAD